MINLQAYIIAPIIWIMVVIVTPAMKGEEFLTAYGIVGGLLFFYALFLKFKVIEFVIMYGSIALIRHLAGYLHGMRHFEGMYVILFFGIVFFLIANGVLNGNYSGGSSSGGGCSGTGCGNGGGCSGCGGGCGGCGGD